MRFVKLGPYSQRSFTSDVNPYFKEVAKDHQENIGFGRSLLECVPNSLYQDTEDVIN